MITYDYKKIIKIATPLILGMLIQVLIGVTDTAFLGHVGEVELGASAIAGIIYLLVFMIIQSFAVGAQIIMARRNGEKKYKRIALVCYQAISFSIIFAIISCAAFYFILPYILNYSIKSKLVADAILIYLIPRSVGFFFSGSKSAMRAFFIATTKTYQLLIAALILLSTNFLFDYWLIFGGLGIEPMGLKGAAIASVIAEFCAAAYLACYILFKVDLVKYGFNKFLIWRNCLFIEISKLSVWIIIQNALGWSVWLYFFIEIEKYGENALAISNILRSISSIPYMFAGGLAMVTSSIISNLIGMNKGYEIMPTLKRIVKIGVLPYYGCLALMVCFPNVAIGIYTDNPDIIALTLEPYNSMVISGLLALPALIYFYAIYGTGKTKVAFIYEIIASAIYVVTIRLMTAILNLDLVWCWLSESFYYVALLPLSYFYVKCNKWNNQNL